MILKSLTALARREGLVDDPDFEPKPVRWIINLAACGRFLGVVTHETVDDRTKKSKPSVMQVPRSPVRTSGSLAAFLVDKSEYVLGHDPDDNPKKVDKLPIHNQLFAEYVERALALEPDDPGLLAVLAFLRDDAQKALCIAEIGGHAAGNDLLAFAFHPEDGSPAARVHDRDAVRSAWRRLRTAHGRGKASAQCLVCGELAPMVRVHPQVKRVPGGSTSGIALVSFNSPAFESLALEGNANAPVCQPCAEAYGTALNRLFHPEYQAGGKTLGRRSFRLSEDTAVVYWASESHLLEDEFGDLNTDDPAKAEHLLNSIRKGVEYRLDEPTHFHALIVTGGQGRATLRGYHEATVGRVACNIGRYLEDVDVVPRFANPRPLSLRWLVRSLAALGKDENVDPNLAGQFFLAILQGSPFPPAILQAALRRIRNEPENPERRQYKHTRERVALIRAALNRRFRAEDPTVTHLIAQEITPMLDPSCINKAYCLGRLFAVLEKLQGEAIGNPGATIADRFYGSASATPVAVFSTLIRKAMHHLAKMEGPFYAKKIQEILDLLEPRDPFPRTLSMEEQGLFALGYYHQKADLWKGKDKGEPEGSEAEADTAAAV